MAWVLRLFLALLLFTGGPARPAQCEDEPKSLRISATSTIPLRRNVFTSIEVAPDGSTRVTLAPRLGAEPSLDLAFRLTAEEFEEGRRAVTASHFFGNVDAPRVPTIHDQWRVTVHLGDEERTRVRLTQPEFKPLRAYLSRFVTLADIVAGLRRGQSDRARTALLYPRGIRVLQPRILVTELVACAAGREDPRRCADVAKLLVAVPAAEDWLRGAKGLLRQLEGERRAAVLAVWGRELRTEARAAHRAAFTPLALHEVTTTWTRWLSMSQKGRGAFSSLQEVLLRDSAPQALEIAEKMARTLGTPGKPVVPPGLLATGTAAIPVVGRLLAAPEPGARASGAKMAYIQVSVVRGKMRIGVKFAPDVLAALERRLGDEIVPLLEQLSRDATEPHGVRETCFLALDCWDGRVKAAKAKTRALREAEREREKAEPAGLTPATPTEGALAIAGRLLGPSDLPLPGFHVHALGRDVASHGSAATAEDGFFRIEGLAAGEHKLSYTSPGQSARWAWARSSPTATGIAAGRKDVILRLPGSLIRGRLVDASGSPVVGRRIVARMRNEPSVQGPTYGSAGANTDAQGKFWFVQLMPGIYDIRVPGHQALQGATGIEAGTEERTVQLLAGSAIAGRVVDERGAPLAGVSVSLSDAQKTMHAWSALQHATTAKDGTFRFVKLRASHHYRVWASIGGGGSPQRNVVADSVPSGTDDLVLRIDTSPRLRFAVDFGKRGQAGSQLRVERIGAGSPRVRSFRTNPVSWLAAPAGKWRVFAPVWDLDAQGKRTARWLEVGTVATGEPEKTLTVPE